MVQIVVGQNFGVGEEKDVIRKMGYFSVNQ